MCAACDLPGAAEAKPDTELPKGLRTRYRVSGMDCASCATKIDNALRRVPGVAEVNVSVPTGTVTVAHDDTVVPAVLARQIGTLGFKVTGQGPADAKAARPKKEHSGSRPWPLSRS